MQRLVAILLSLAILSLQAMPGAAIPGGLRKGEDPYGADDRGAPAMGCARASQGRGPVALPADLERETDPEQEDSSASEFLPVARIRESAAGQIVRGRGGSISPSGQPATRRLHIIFSLLLC